VMVRERDLQKLKLDGSVVAREESFPWQGQRGIRDAVVLVRLKPKNPG